MIQLKRFISLTTLLLLSCSYSWCQNDNLNLPTGDGDSIKCDSVLISINDIKIANAKMIELNYEKEINRNLRSTIQIDSTIINSLRTNLAACKLNAEAEIKEIKKQRNIAIATGSGTSLLFLILLIVL